MSETTEYSRSELSARLSGLVNTQPSINGLSKWIIHRSNHAHESVELWSREFFDRLSKQPLKTRLDKRLLLLYVVNDIIQNTKKSYGPYFVDKFAPRLLPALKAYFVDAEGNKKLQDKIARMVKIWEDRSVVTSDLLRKVKLIVETKGACEDSEILLENEVVIGGHIKPLRRSGSSRNDEIGVYEGILASDNEEDQEQDPVADHVTATRLVTAANDEALSSSLKPEHKDLLKSIEKFDFSLIDDELMWEKVERLKETVDTFEKQEGWGNEDAPDSAAVGVAAEKEKETNAENDDLYTTVHVEEEFTLNFEKENQLLTQFAARMKSALDLNEEMMDTFISVTSDSGTEIEQLSEATAKPKLLSKRIRDLARIVRDENIKRKQARHEKEEAARLEAAKKRAEGEQKKKEEELKRKKSNAKDLAAKFLNKFKATPTPPAGPVPPRGPPPSSSLSSSVLQQLSMAMSAPNAPVPPPPQPPYHHGEYSPRQAGDGYAPRYSPRDYDSYDRGYSPRNTGRDSYGPPRGGDHYMTYPPAPRPPPYYPPPRYRDDYPPPGGPPPPRPPPPRPPPPDGHSRRGSSDGYHGSRRR